MLCFPFCIGHVLFSKPTASILAPFVSFPSFCQLYFSSIHYELAMCCRHLPSKARKEKIYRPPGTDHGWMHGWNKRIKGRRHATPHHNSASSRYNRILPTTCANKPSEITLAYSTITTIGINDQEVIVVVEVVLAVLVLVVAGDTKMGSVVVDVVSVVSSVGSCNTKDMRFNSRRVCLFVCLAGDDVGDCHLENQRFELATVLSPSQSLYRSLLLATVEGLNRHVLASFIAKGKNLVRLLHLHCCCHCCWYARWDAIVYRTRTNDSPIMKSPVLLRLRQ